VCTATGSVNGYCGSSDWAVNGSIWDYAFSPTWPEVYRNCTDYVAYWEFFQNLGGNIFKGDAGQWGYDSVSGWSKTSTPHMGDIAWWAGNPGHVAVVTTVLANGSVAVEEFNENPAYYGTDGVRVGVNATAYLHRS
jgi:surface antigen